VGEGFDIEGKGVGVERYGSLVAGCKEKFELSLVGSKINH